MCLAFGSHACIPKREVAPLREVATDINVAVAAVCALDYVSAAAILDALNQEALFSLAEKVGKPMQMVTRVLDKSDRGSLQEAQGAMLAAQTTADSQTAIAMLAIKEAAREAKEARASHQEARASHQEARAAQGATSAMDKEIAALRSSHQESEARRAVLEKSLAAASEEILALRTPSTAAGGSGLKSIVPVPSSPHHDADVSPANEGEATRVDQSILDAAIDIPPHTFTPAQLAHMGYSNHTCSLSQLFGKGGASSAVTGTNGIEHLVRRSIEYLATSYGARVTYGETTYDPANDIGVDGVDDEDGVDNLDSYDDNMFTLVDSSETLHPDIVGLSTGEYIPRGTYADIMYRCANEVGEVRSDGQPTDVGAPLTFEARIQAGGTDETAAAAAAAAAAVHIARPVLSGRLLEAGGKAEVLGVFHAVADARDYDAKRSNAAAIGNLAEADAGWDPSTIAESSPASFSLSADLDTVTRGMARALLRVEELQRLEMATLHTDFGGARREQRLAPTSASFFVTLKRLPYSVCSFFETVCVLRPLRMTGSPRQPTLYRLVEKTHTGDKRPREGFFIFGNAHTGPLYGILPAADIGQVGGLLLCAQSYDLPP
jgi:hypothetical protein